MCYTEGGFIAFRAITVEEQEMFDKVMKGLIGPKYVPFAVATQVVAGINYAFFCNASQVGADKIETGVAFVVIHKPLPGEGKSPSLLKISNVKVVD